MNGRLTKRFAVFTRLRLATGIFSRLTLPIVTNGAQPPEYDARDLSRVLPQEAKQLLHLVGLWLLYMPEDRRHQQVIFLTDYVYRHGGPTPSKAPGP